MAEGSNRHRVLAVLLVLVGLLILSLSGTCTLGIISGDLAVERPPTPMGHPMGPIMIPLTIGGPFIVLGAGSTFVGIQLFRSKRSSAAMQPWARKVGAAYLILGGLVALLSVLLFLQTAGEWAILAAIAGAAIAALGWWTRNLD